MRFFLIFGKHDGHEEKRIDLISFCVLSSLCFSSELGRKEQLSSTVPKALYCKLNKSLVVDAGGRNEETSSKYAAGARIKQVPSRRQQQRGVGADGND
ncbi:MAG: hypothetical protein ACYS1A_17040 [Planctomycetota bacterium]